MTVYDEKVFLALAIEKLVERGHLLVNWSAGRPGDFQPQSYADLGLLGSALVLAAYGELDTLDRVELQQLVRTWMTDALVNHGRQIMPELGRAPTASELRDRGVSQQEVAQSSPRKSRGRLSTRLSHAHLKFRVLHREGIGQASEHAAAILAAEFQDHAPHVDVARAS